MLESTRKLRHGLTACLLIAAQAVAQQWPAPATALSAQPPPGFQLNPLQQASLDLVLDAWQQRSAQIEKFRCAFERLDYNFAFGPDQRIPLFKNQGEVSFEKPDKGSFQIVKIEKWQDDPAPPGQPPPAQRTGKYVLDGQAVGEHWMCDGTHIYEYRHAQKQLVVRAIPPQLQGQAIVDGPLPFLFGADAARLKARYWLRIDELQGTAPGQGPTNPNEIWIDALPRSAADAANYSKVQLILDRQQLLPKAMQVHLPDQSRNVYVFNLAEASINKVGRWDQIKAWFKPPDIPRGWQRVDEPLPLEQAAQPIQAPR